MFSILLLSVYLISTTELGQLLKFPILIEHYFDHKEKNPEVTVLQFLEVHYAGSHLENHPHDDDYEQDKQLPFIVHIDVLNISFVLVPPFSFDIETKKLVGKEPKTLPLDDTFSDNNYRSAIWQPPKFC
ncbi:MULTISPECIES: hypothetical protein [Sphingobacterium]|uniref:Uncharacterized protein n=2 Tax=Sphingobacteriaceae TaxID=84566 RepID=A0A8H9FZE1_9SPHI|nr:MULTISPECIES: hypothetical protein [Sphingobacterium]CDS97992.1 conserved hypothetical protein [Sphingobacterium sp. PM2-P1-29]MBA8985074.1 hypothetical protein [Sphingobacterium soli]OYD40703.1 hypothetical protein CHT99_16985 [Sphingobacterium cellulitidis]OYD45045.1 hypothetical protein CHU00_13760 [Sphingobacterium cellulitidis]GGE12414.1 hypothetical protein GCM10011516_07730 [Sphingobacterium soli]